ncbi:MAG: glycosyltransferase [Bacteroidales bacterium]|nr:glycosyltransferase [Bacteroidales bacterium]
MRILICVSGNAEDYRFETTQVFVWEQIEAVCRRHPEVAYRVFAVRESGIRGYLRQRRLLMAAIRDFRPDIIHAHCGHIGALAVLQRKVPVVTTFHGSDINQKGMRPVSVFASLFSRVSVFVARGLADRLPLKGRRHVILPCGVDRSIFFPAGISSDKPYVLFSSAFDNPVKNAPLARRVMAHFPELELREIKGKTRQEVADLINGAQLVLMTSFSEGSPQIIKEALCCGQRIVSVRVGDVAERLQGLRGCRVCDADEAALSEAIRAVLQEEKPSGDAGRAYDNDIISEKLFTLYQNLQKR